MIKHIVFSACVFSVLSTNVAAQSRTKDGATLGGVAGAVIGGIIGHQNDETPEGAIIGGAVGAIAGGLLGKAQDQELARQRYAQQQTYYQAQQQAYVQQQAIANAGISVTDVINMSRSGVSESLIMSQMQAKGVQRRLEVSEIISLHQQGISDTIISAMQAAPLATQVAAKPLVVPQTQLLRPQTNVIVREPIIYHAPVVVEECYRPYRYYHRPYYRASGTSFHIGF